MMELPRKAKLSLLTFLVLLNIAIRFPTVPHEIGSDGFFIHALANSITQEGYAKWIIHPASAYGLYPLSYPSGIPFLLSGASQATGVDMEWIIFFISILFSLLGTFSVYIMAGNIKNSFVFKFFTAYAFSLAPIFLELTYWRSTTRPFFVALLPILFWSLFKIQSEKSKTKYLLIIIVLLFVIPSVHHMALLLPLVVTAYGVSNFIFLLKEKLVISPCISHFIILTIFGALFLIQFTNFSIYNPSLDLFDDYLIKKDGIGITILNIGVFYTLAIGVLFLFSIIGLLLLIRKTKKSKSEIFYLITLLFFISFLIDTRYIVLFILPLLSVLISWGVFELLSNLQVRRFVSITVLIIILLLSLSFSYLIVNEYIEEDYRSEATGYTLWMDEHTYATALFIKEYSNSNPVALNDYRRNRMIWAISEVPTFKSKTPEDPQLLIYDYVNENELEISNIPLTDVYLEHNIYFWELKNEEELFSNESKYDFQYAVINKHYPQKVGWSRYPSRLIFSELFNTINKSMYKIYDNGMLEIRYLK